MHSSGIGVTTVVTSRRRIKSSYTKIQILTLLKQHVLNISEPKTILVFQKCTCIVFIKKYYVIEFSY